MRRTIRIIAIGAALTISTVLLAAESGKSMTPKEECEVLMNALMPFAQKMLAKNRAFLPFGASMSATGQVAAAMGAPTNEHADANELISTLEQGFRDGAKKGQLKATGIAVDIKIVPPGKTAKQDAVEIRLDHRAGYSVRVIFPYSFSDKGDLAIEAPFAAAGAGRVFKR
jgi:hypothetical protein